MAMHVTEAQYKDLQKRLNPEPEQPKEEKPKDKPVHTEKFYSQFHVALEICSLVRLAMNPAAWLVAVIVLYLFANMIIMGLGF